MIERKKDPVWAAAPTVDDYAAAATFLSLTMSDDLVRASIAGIRASAVVQFRAQDLLRAARLEFLGPDDPHVADKIKLIKDGVQLPPALLVQGDATRHLPLIIADGFHRLCAVYARDTEGTVPCKLAVGIFI